jgi:hypothetical protein
VAISFVVINAVNLDLDPCVVKRKDFEGGAMTGAKRVATVLGLALNSVKFYAAP